MVVKDTLYEVGIKCINTKVNVYDNINEEGNNQNQFQLWRHFHNNKVLIKCLLVYQKATFSVKTMFEMVNIQGKYHLSILIVLYCLLLST